MASGPRSSRSSSGFPGHNLTWFGYLTLASIIFSASTSQNTYTILGEINWIPCFELRHLGGGDVT